MNKNNETSLSYTKFDNGLLETLSKIKLNATQLKIILVIARYTLGYHRDKHELSVNFISEITGIHNQQIKSELKKLIENKVITEVEAATFTTSRVLQINFNFQEWKVRWYQGLDKQPGTKFTTTTGNEFTTTPGSELNTSPGSKFTTKKRKDKENIKKSEVIDFFEKIWSYYPRKIGKEKITFAQKEKLFMEVGEEKLMQAVRNYKKEIEGIEERFILHGSTFFLYRYIEYLPSAESEIINPSGKFRAIERDENDIDIAISIETQHNISSS